MRCGLVRVGAIGSIGGLRKKDGTWEMAKEESGEFGGRGILGYTPIPPANRYTVTKRINTGDFACGNRYIEPLHDGGNRYKPGFGVRHAFQESTRISAFAGWSSGSRISAGSVSLRLLIGPSNYE